MAERADILVVASRTASSDALVEHLAARAAGGAARFFLVVPATPGGIAWAADMDSGQDAARRRMQAAVSRWRTAGLPLVDARLGHPDPLAAALDAVNFGRFGEVVVSTLPRHLSAWLKLNLPHRVAHATGLPVTHVEAPRRHRAPGTSRARAPRPLRRASRARG